MDNFKIGDRVTLSERAISKGLYARQIETGMTINGTVTKNSDKGDTVFVKVDDIEKMAYKWHKRYWVKI